jgi:hypothetical protein
MIDEKYLKTVKNYAKTRVNRKGKRGVSKTYVWDLIKKDIIGTVEIDGVVFVDTKKA